MPGGGQGEGQQLGSTLSVLKDSIDDPQDGFGESECEGKRRDFPTPGATSWLCRLYNTGCPPNTRQAASGKAD